MISTAEVVEALRDWLPDKGFVGMDVSGGEIGRPGDNLYEVTGLAALHRKVIIELDAQIVLVLTDPSRITRSPKEFIVNDCLQVVIDWQEYINLRPHAKVVTAATVRLTR